MSAIGEATKSIRNVWDWVCDRKIEIGILSAIFAALALLACMSGKRRAASIAQENPASAEYRASVKEVWMNNRKSDRNPTVLTLVLVGLDGSQLMANAASAEVANDLRIWVRKDDVISLTLPKPFPNVVWIESANDVTILERAWNKPKEPEVEKPEVKEKEGRIY